MPSLQKKKLNRRFVFKCEKINIFHNFAKEFIGIFSDMKQTFNLLHVKAETFGWTFLWRQFIQVSLYKA